MFKNSILIGGAVIVKVEKKKFLWFIIRSSSSDTWELPKIVVRKTESSVRGVIRMMGEQGGMRARVLEEAGRVNSSIKKADKVISQRQIFYLMLHRADSGESIGFPEVEWLEYAKASRKLSLKREAQMLREANKIFKIWYKVRKGKLKSADEIQMELLEQMGQVEQPV